ncbi:MAG: hypothetical protein DRP00_03720 [Candidatus Aenigmatarchaeota archaeon]|nr:MAG: hypothetical protein DRP00_03720 [Candidatus Aenigmarchaeota archaeon]
MRVKCPKCGYEFEVGESPDLLETDIASELLVPIDVKELLYCSPYKEIHLSCGHVIRCEFAQFHRGQQVWCSKCNRTVEVTKCIDTITGKECNFL